MPHPSIFASLRERRLWFFTAVAILGVYATLVLSSTLMEFYYNQGVAAAAFLGAMFLIASSALALALRNRPKLVEIGIGLGIAVIYAMLLFRMTFPERSHLIEYGVIALLMHEALTERRRSGRHVPAPWLIAILATGLVGVVDESVQIFLPERVFDPIDMLFNLFASALAVGSMAVLAYARRLVGERRRA